MIFRENDKKLRDIGENRPNDPIFPPQNIPQYRLHNVTGHSSLIS